MKLPRTPVLLSVASLAALFGAACGTAPSTAPGSVSTRAERAAAPAGPVVHDRGEVSVVARSADGRIWGVGPRDGEALLRWEDEGWKKVESLAELPGTVIALAPDPARPGFVVSLKSSRLEGGEQSVLHLHRHGEGSERVALASFANTVLVEGQRRSQTPSLVVDAAGDYWLSFRAPLLLRVPAQGGEPERIEVPQAWFKPMRGTGVTRHFALRFTPEPEGRGEGWLWSVIGEAMPVGFGALPRPVRLREARVEPCPPLAGLPAEAPWVSCVVAIGRGRAIWALEDAGLWEIDLASGKASPLPSPPGAWRILDYARPAEGVEVALVVSPRRSPDRLSGDVWVRLAGGEWRLAGPSGDVRSSTSAVDGWHIRPRSWAVVDGLLLGAPFTSGLAAVDLRAELPVALSLDWRAGLRLGGPRDLFVLPDGRLLVQGSIATAAPAAEWRRLWANALALGEGEPGGGVARFTGSVIRATDGRLWALQASGRGAPCVRHWDGARWERWALPPEREWWPEDGFFVEARSGRVVVTGEGPNTPAWVRDEGAEGGWRSLGTVREWLAAWVDAGEDAEVLPRSREGYLRRPIFGPQGRVLIGYSGGLWLRRKGEWLFFSTRELGAAAWRYGFDEEGEPWVATQRERRRLLAGGGVGAPEPWRDPEARGTSSHATRQPDWLRAWLRERTAEAVQVDASSVWWILREGELWAAREGEFVRVFEDEEPSPFRIARSGGFWSVEVDASGHRFFAATSPVFLPALPARALELRWEGGEDEADRVGEIMGGGRVEWRLGEERWRPASGGRIELIELPAGEHRLELRGEDRRLNPQPAQVHALRVDYDEAARVERLLAWLGEASRRNEAVRRLALRGEALEARLRAELGAEQDEARRWWLRAALQAVEDRRGLGDAP